MIVIGDGAFSTGAPRPVTGVRRMRHHRQPPVGQGVHRGPHHMPGTDDKHFPSPATLRKLPDEERAEALLRERSLLYVASSRARDVLVVTWSGNRTELLASGG